MARPIEIHPDPIVRDLQTIRRLKWSRTRDFTTLETVLAHPLIVHLAQEPDGIQERVEALRASLKATTDRIKAYEKANPPPLGRSVAVASTALLRLTPKFEVMPIENIRIHIASSWGKRGGGHVSPDGFRQHLEVPGVYEPFAAEFRRFAREQATELGFKLNEPKESYPATSAPSTRLDLNGTARRLWEMETQSYEERRASLQNDGALEIRNEEEMHKILLMLTESAKEGFYAVDLSEASDWFSNLLLNDYLKRQLSLVKEGKVTLERIHRVTERELNEPRATRPLQELIRLHDEASAKLILCPPGSGEERSGEVQTVFQPYMGLLVVDAEGKEPVVVTGKLGDGEVGHAFVYTRSSEESRAYQREYDRLKGFATTMDYDRELREKLIGPS